MDENNIKKEVIEYLKIIAPNMTKIENSLIEFKTNKVINKVKNITKNEEIEDLHEIIIEMICGEILLFMKSSGQDIGISVEKEIKSIKEGDTDITFTDTTSKSQELDNLINKLLHENFDYSPYSKMGW